MRTNASNLPQLPSDTSVQFSNSRRHLHQPQTLYLDNSNVRTLSHLIKMRLQHLLKPELKLHKCTVLIGVTNCHITDETHPKVSLTAHRSAPTSRCQTLTPLRTADRPKGNPAMTSETCTGQTQSALYHTEGTKRCIGHHRP